MSAKSRAASQSTLSPGELTAQLGELLLAGGTLGDVYDYDEQDYEVLYALGHSLYSQGRYQDAVKAFGFLVLHHHLERRYLSAFAASLQMVKRYEDALCHYSMASVLDLDDPLPTFHSAECLLALGRVDEAHQAMALVLKQVGGEEHAALRERARTLSTLIAEQRAKAQKEQ